MNPVSRRDSLALGLTGLAALGLPATASATVGLVPGTRAFELTFLKAKPGLRAQLGRYITANWFAMDSKGLEQGLFTCFWLLEETEENAAWDYVMVVGYPTDLGYGDSRTVTLFEAIRKAHVETRIDGKGLRDLGDFVGNNRLKVATA